MVEESRWDDVLPPEEKDELDSEQPPAKMSKNTIWDKNTASSSEGATSDRPVTSSGERVRSMWPVSSCRGTSAVNSVLFFGATAEEAQIRTQNIPEVTFWFILIEI